MKFFRPMISRKLVLASAVSLALAAGQPALAANQQLEFVPDDTLFYFGTGKPVPVADFFAMVPGFFDPEALEDLIPELDDVKDKDEKIAQITDFLKDPAKFAKQYGIGEDIQFSAYSVGFLPVLRIAGDTEKFKTVLEDLAAKGDDAAEDNKIEKITHKGIEVLVSPMDDDDGEKAPKVNVPTAAEIQAAESKLSDIKENGDIAAQALDEATRNLDTAKQANDASGIARAANEMAAAAGEVSKISAEQADAENALASLRKKVTDSQKQNVAGGKSGAGVIIAADKGDLIFSISSNAYDPQLLDQLLGLEKPQKSIDASGKLKKIRKEWGYGDEIAMFLDFTLVADAITGGDSRAAKQLQAFSAEDAKAQSELRVFAQEPCRSEVRQIAANWPMMVSGNRRFEVNDEIINVDTHFAMLLENKALRDTLKLVRGIVPVSQSSSDAMLSLGLGLNVDTTPQFAAQLTEFVSAVSYECEPLLGLNKINETDISALSMGAMMFSGMARGVKGLSVNVYDTEIDVESDIPVKNVDAAIAIAAEDPATLVQTLQMLPQMNMLSGLPLDGTPVLLNDLLPVPMPDGVEMFAAVKDKSIVFYSGTQASDFAGRLGGNGDEGFFIASFNGKKFVEKLDAVAEQLPEDVRKEEELDKLVELAKAYPIGQIMYKMDFTDNGIEFESVSEIERPRK